LLLKEHSGANDINYSFTYDMNKNFKYELVAEYTNNFYLLIIDIYIANDHLSIIYLDDNPPNHVDDIIHIRLNDITNTGLLHKSLIDILNN
jgi:hypothetical protein